MTSSVELLLIGLLMAGLAIVLERGIKLWKKKKYEATDYYNQTKTDYDKLLKNTGSLGEFYIYEDLKPLQGHKKYLYNCYLPKEDEATTEIDVILLHESGIYVMESKNYSGWIFGKEQQKNWMQTLPTGKGSSQKEYFLNPIMQNKGHIKWLKRYLGDEKEFPVYSYIVFSERCELKNVTLTSGEHHVIKRNQLLQAIQQNAQIVGTQLSVEEIDLLYQKLRPLTLMTAEQKQAHIEKIQQKVIGEELERINQDNETAIEHICPQCGGKLVLRTAKNGVHEGNQFWGCSNYPKCNYIKNK